MRDIEVIRKTGLQKLAANVKKFFGEFKTLDFADLSPNFVQQVLDLHELGIKDFLGKYAEQVKP